MIGQKNIAVLEELSSEHQKKFIKHLSSSNIKRKAASVRVGKRTLLLLASDNQANRVKSIEALVKEYGAAQLRNIYSELSAELSNYLCLNYLETNPGFKNWVVFKSTNRLQLSRTAHLISNQKKVPSSEPSSFNTLLAYETNKIAFKQNESEDVDYLTAQYQKIERYARYEKLKLLISIFFKHDLDSEEISEEVKLEVRSILEHKQKDRSELMLSGLEYALDLEVSNDIDSFNYLFLLLQKIDRSGYYEEVTVLLLTCYNFCVRRLNHGQEEYGVLLRELIIQRMKISEIKIKEAELRNFILGLCRFGDSTIAEYWLYDRINDITPLLRNDVRNLCLATIKSYRQELLEAIKYLSKVRSSNSFYYVQSKAFLIRIYYERAEFEACKAVLENLRIHLLRERKLPSNPKRSLKDLVRLTKKLIKIAEIPIRSQMKIMALEMIEEVKLISELVNKKWFLDQLNKLSS